jgi:hypothetical protein
MRLFEEAVVSALRDAFVKAKDQSRASSAVRQTPAAGQAVSSVEKGARWVRDVLVAAIESGNEALEGENVAFQLDVNLDPRSTNHAHADFWMAETGEGQRANGPRYSINVIGGETVWLYKPGAPGQVLGTIAQCDGKKIQDLLQMAAEEFGKQLGKTAAQ